jgi:hypothetical protein
MQAQHYLPNEVAYQIDSGSLRSTLTETVTPINAANLRTAHAKRQT